MEKQPLKSAPSKKAIIEVGPECDENCFFYSYYDGPMCLLARKTKNPWIKKPFEHCFNAQHEYKLLKEARDKYKKDSVKLSWTENPERMGQ